MFPLVPSLIPFMLIRSAGFAEMDKQAKERARSDAPQAGKPPTMEGMLRDMGRLYPATEAKTFDPRGVIWIDDE